MEDTKRKRNPRHHVNHDVSGGYTGFDAYNHEDKLDEVGGNYSLVSTQKVLIKSDYDQTQITGASLIQIAGESIFNQSNNHFIHTEEKYLNALENRHHHMMHEDHQQLLSGPCRILMRGDNEKAIVIDYSVNHKEEAEPSNDYSIGIKIDKTGVHVTGNNNDIFIPRSSKIEFKQDVHVLGHLHVGCISWGGCSSGCACCPHPPGGGGGSCSDYSY
ncbi:MAG: hypothetical protein DRI86_05620 [Bacteroidetes bacterium]|nr:MAG: hypothetical protein DRI86_05620 [Bacteroidota bacterium]